MSLRDGVLLGALDNSLESFMYKLKNALDENEKRSKKISQINQKYSEIDSLSKPVEKCMS